MLRDLLARMASGGIKTPESLARDLGVGPAEIGEMLERLCSLGYLEELSSSLTSSCSDEERRGKGCAGCSGCSFGSSCFEASQSRVWTLSQKGKEVLARSPRIDRL